MSDDVNDLDLDELLEVAPGHFKRLGECTASDLEGWSKVGHDHLVLAARFLAAHGDLSAVVEALGLEEYPMPEELNEAREENLRRHFAGEPPPERDLPTTRRLVALMERTVVFYRDLLAYSPEQRPLVLDAVRATGFATLRAGREPLQS